MRSFGNRYDPNGRAFSPSPEILSIRHLVSSHIFINPELAPLNCAFGQLLGLALDCAFGLFVDPDLTSHCFSAKGPSTSRTTPILGAA